MGDQRQRSNLLMSKPGRSEADARLDALLAGLRAGSDGAAGIYTRYLDDLPSQFGRGSKLAHEADLVLATLAACELAHRRMLMSQAPTALRLVGETEDGQPLFGATATRPVFDGSEQWTGVPLRVLAEVLGRARPERNRDDQPYQALLVFALFRLKAALGVWRGESSAGAHYRLWLKDLAEIIAAHPRLAPLVQSAHRRIIAATLDVAERWQTVLDSDRSGRARPPAAFNLLAPMLAAHAELAAGGTDDAGLAAVTNLLSRTALHIFRGGDLVLAVRGFAQTLGLRCASPAMTGDRINDLAATYQNRAVALRQARGPAAALPDYDAAVKILEALRDELLGDGRLWPPEYRYRLAVSFFNRALLFQSDGNASGARQDVGSARRILDELQALFGGVLPPAYVDLRRKIDGLAVVFSGE